MSQIIPAEWIENRIFFLRGHKIMLDSTLAELYQVENRTLIQAVKRNIKRFPSDFAFQLNYQELTILRSQIVILRKGHGEHSKYLPYAFTEQGIAMLSSVLRSERAILVNIEIMRTFVQLRALLISNKELAHKLAVLEKKYDHQFKIVFDAIRELMTPATPFPPTSKPRIGF